MAALRGVRFLDLVTGEIDFALRTASELTLDQAGDQLIDMVVRTCNGRLTCAEVMGHREFVLTKLYQSA